MRHRVNNPWCKCDICLAARFADARERTLMTIAGGPGWLEYSLMRERWLKLATRAEILELIFRATSTTFCCEVHNRGAMAT